MDRIAWLVFSLMSALATFRIIEYFVNLNWGRLILHEKVARTLPVDFKQEFLLRGYDKARIIIRSPYISLLSFRGHIVAQNRKNEALGKLLINEKPEVTEYIPTRLIEARRKRSTWVSSEFIEIPRIDQNDPTIVVSFALDWRAKDSIFMPRDKEVSLEISVRVKGRV